MAEKIEAAMTPEELRDWMDEYAFNPDNLAEALGCHRQSIFKWRNGTHPITYTVTLALKYLASDRKALRERQRLIEEAERLRERQHQLSESQHGARARTPA